jgi:hypothetical protein
MNERQIVRDGIVVGMEFGGGSVCLVRRTSLSGNLRQRSFFYFLEVRSEHWDLGFFSRSVFIILLFLSLFACLLC